MKEIWKVIRFLIMLSIIPIFLTSGCKNKTNEPEAVNDKINIPSYGYWVVWFVEDSVNIGWETGGIEGSFSVYLYKGETKVKSIVENGTSTGSSWHVRYYVPPDLEEGDDYRIKVVYSSVYTAFSAKFNVSKGHIEVLEPAQNDDIWRTGQNYTIRWKTGGLGGAVKIELVRWTINGTRVTEKVIGTNISNSGTYNFTLNALPLGNYSVIITFNNQEYFSGAIAILDPIKKITVSNPGSTTVWLKGNTYDVEYAPYIYSIAGLGDLDARFKLENESGSKSEFIDASHYYQFIRCTVPTNLSPTPSSRWRLYAEVYQGSYDVVLASGYSDYFRIQ